MCKATSRCGRCSTRSTASGGRRRAIGSSGSYETLGAFPNSCVAGTVHHEPDTFHCKCRDAFLTGGPPALSALFERCVVLDDAREARRGLEAGVLERVRIAKF